MKTPEPQRTLYPTIFEKVKLWAESKEGMFTSAEVSASLGFFHKIGTPNTETVTPSLRRLVELGVIQKIGKIGSGIKHSSIVYDKKESPG